MNGAIEMMLTPTANVARGVRATTPPEDSAPRTSKPKVVAAGMPAIISTAKHGIRKMGAIRSISNLRNVNKFDGFDCPGCAWPDPDGHRTFAEFCENGAKAVADEATKRKAGPDFWKRWSVSELSKKSDHWLNEQGRITQPLVLRQKSDHYEKISWVDAFEMIGDYLGGVSDPDQAIFYTSGRTSNEAAFLWQLLARTIGTNNLPDCSNMCHESSGHALTESIGIGKGTVTLDDFNHSDLILVVGQNPGTNHPRMLTALRDAKMAGSSVVSINPLTEAGMGRFKHPQKPLEVLGSGTIIADEHVNVRINGDMALFRGYAKAVISEDAFDSEFIGNHTQGFDDYYEIVRKTDWGEIESLSGVHREDIVRIGKKIAQSKSMIVCWAMGLTQHKNAVQTIQEIANVSLLGGHIGRSGAGLCPVRGHSNVQGDRTVGINHRPSPSFLDALDERFGIDSPRKPGCDAVEAVRRMSTSKSTVFLSMGGNFLSAMSDTRATARALQNCELTVQVSTKPNRSHLVTGKTALILPCLGRTERDSTGVGDQYVTVENSMGVVHMSVGKSSPAGNMLMSEPAIIASIGSHIKQSSGHKKIPWMELVNDYDNIRNEIESVIPGFESYNERSRKRGGFYLPNPPRDSLEFQTRTGKANFIVNPMSSISSDDGKFVMMSIRSHDQYNTTIYGLDDRYRGVKGGRRVVLVNKTDMEENGWEKLQVVNISSHYEGKQLSSDKWYIVPYDIPPGNVATYFPESNELIPLESVADLSNTPTSKSVLVSISKSN
ncbi:MAG: FdhF/YdeP family oxidoreductase [Candidatus Thalassarchaeaceae archaeon]|jgi:molybdopterin-dependent oxidoreductase alpha subunit|nr:FdhF/YdeP family oxidoreductase [Candidatus Thalassarchaeaceae archaeon]